MLRQIDLHNEQLAKHNEQLDRHTEQLTKQSARSDASWTEQRLVNQRLFSQMDSLEQRISEQQGVINQNLELVLHTANILDHIIKKNSLKT